MKERRLGVGHQMVVTLIGLEAAGFRWSVRVGHPDVVAVARIEVEKKRARLPGESVDEEFELTGLKQGKTAVQFTLARNLEAAGPPCAVHDILVVVS
jgi:predicted secreted protein